MVKVVLATRNSGKLRELRELTGGTDIEWIGLDAFPDVPEAIEDGDTFAENATKKALHYAQATGLPALADDSGLEVDALGGEPGVRSASYAGPQRSDADNNRKLIEALRDTPPEKRTARFHCCMVFAADGRTLFTTEGRIEGRIIDEPRGANGFGYDPHFFAPEKDCTTAELPSAEKNAISHRGRALRRMLEKLVVWAQQQQQQKA